MNYDLSNFMPNFVWLCQVKDNVDVVRVCSFVVVKPK